MGEGNGGDDDDHLTVYGRKTDTDGEDASDNDWPA